MGASWEVDEERLISSEKCACGQGIKEYYEIKESHTKVSRERTRNETIIKCSNPDCPSKRPPTQAERMENERKLKEWIDSLQL